MFHRTFLILAFLTLALAAACGRTSAPPASTEALTPTMEFSSSASSTPMMMPIENYTTHTPAPTVTPFPTFTPAPTQADASTAVPECTNLVEFIKSLTVGDNTALEHETPFAKIWLVRNAGTCTWSAGYSLVYVTGDQLGSPYSEPLTKEVRPGETIELRLNLIAPAMAGVYTGSWMLQDLYENRFGLLPDGSQPLNLTIEVKPTPLPTSS